VPELNEANSCDRAAMDDEPLDFNGTLQGRVAMQIALEVYYYLIRTREHKIKYGTIKTLKQ